VKQRNAELKQRRDQSTMEIWRTMQSTLEAALHRVAELEVLQCIDDVKRNAVESGLVVSPVDNRIGKCLLCLDDLALASESGAKICLKCTNKVRIHQDEASEKVSKATTSAEMQEARTEYFMFYWCPSCRALCDKLDAKIASLARNAEAGRAWAPLQMGLMTKEGDGNLEMSRRQSGSRWPRIRVAPWRCLCCASCGKRDFQRSEYHHRKRRQTSTCSRQLKTDPRCTKVQWLGWLGTREGSDTSLIWCTLAAAQGGATAQNALGDFHVNGTHGMPQSVFVAIYWLRKAALH
jgi:hypothetical protein